MPLVHTRWSLFDECDIFNSVELFTPSGKPTPFPPTLMDTTNEPTPSTNNLFLAIGENFTFGKMKQRPIDGRFTRFRLTKTRLADVDLILGWDFLKSECSHLGFFLQTTAPTGSKQCDTTIFSPIIGNNGHWGLGGGVSAHTTLWNGNADQNLAIWLQGNIIHLFRDHQLRVFDFKQNGPFSRFLLLKEFDAEHNATGNLIPASMFTTRSVQTSFAIQGDASVKLAYRNCGLAVDVGYNLFGRSKERAHRERRGGPGSTTTGATVNSRVCEGPCDFFTCETPCSPVNNRRFGIKGGQDLATRIFTTEPSPNGTTRVLGHFDTNPDIGPNPRIINSTASKDTAFGAHDQADNPASPLTPQEQAENLIALASNSTTVPGTPLTDPAIIRSVTSDPPVLVNLRDLNVCSALAKSQLTHKIFGYIGYNWLSYSWCPFIGLLGEVEFDGNRRSRHCEGDTIITDSAGNNPQRLNCNDRRDHAGINQWGVGVKGGFSF
jgi:hypothetical protein